MSLKLESSIIDWKDRRIFESKILILMFSSFFNLFIKFRLSYFQLYFSQEIASLAKFKVTNCFHALSAYSSTNDSKQHAKENYVGMKYGEKIELSVQISCWPWRKEKLDFYSFLFSKLHCKCSEELNYNSKPCKNICISNLSIFFTAVKDNGNILSTLTESFHRAQSA